MGKEYRVVFVLFLALALRIAEAEKPLVGGTESISVDDSKVKKLAESVMKKINEELTGERALILVEIEEATSKIVSGTSYFLRLKVGESNCLKQELSQNCRVDESRPHKACHADIWERLWLKITEIKYSCDK
ncbi:unnamed protein product [Euphydryas editha]|uniref:Cystatin domain-containing protein n=1 Tax=Euphydryas editha TaxID=104508 RepID=A0AAU9TUL3_EUPED|nr:unnamed protein product [Euphydryas editha]